MAEKTLNDALGGAEIREIILQEIEKRLKGDCTLGDDLCYPGFSFTFDMKIYYKRSLVKESLVWGVGGTSQEPVTPEEFGSAVKVEHSSVESPDLERQSHDLPIPVLVQTPQGPQKQKVRVERMRK